MSVATLDNLSALQKKLLKTALMAHYRKPLDNEGQVEDPGCFTVRTVGRTPDPDGFDLKRRKASAEERRKRASWRAACGREVAPPRAGGILFTWKGAAYPERSQDGEGALARGQAYDQT
jgi:hypothetical protein